VQELQLAMVAVAKPICAEPLTKSCNAQELWKLSRMLNSYYGCSNCTRQLVELLVELVEQLCNDSTAQKPLTCLLCRHAAHMQPNEPDDNPLPTEVHLTYWKRPSQMLVSFVSSVPNLAAGPVTNADLPLLKDVKAFVRYGKSPRNYTSQQISNMTFAYIQNNKKVFRRQSLLL
jgi:hypothetical protein